MTKQTIIIHPYIKATFKNLDLDLESELNRYEQYLNSLEHNSARQPQLALPQIESQINLIEEDKSNSPTKILPPLVYESAIILPSEEEFEPIPVASRILTPQKSLLDIVLTPWGVFGLILFFATNILIFDVNQDDNWQTANNSTIVNQTPVNNTIPAQSSETNQSDTSTIIENQSQNQQQNSLPPSPPPPLPTISAEKIVNHNQTTSLYPDLKTALLNESENYQTQLPPPPPLYPVEVEVQSNPTVANNTNNQTTNNQVKAVNPPLNQTAKVAKTNQPVSAPQTKHYVVIDYQSMENYAQVKKTMKEAFITNLNNEMKIQLGVFNDQSGAEKYRQQLKSAGLESKIVSISK